jgi:hypothetical protein
MAWHGAQDEMMESLQKGVFTHPPAAFTITTEGEARQPRGSRRRRRLIGLSSVKMKIQWP